MFYCLSRGNDSDYDLCFCPGDNLFHQRYRR